MEKANKAFKSDSQRLAVSLRSSIAKRHSHLNAALTLSSKYCINTQLIPYHLNGIKYVTVCFL
ncbi:hypothetical protein CE131_24170 [Vibrio parahaemolyticus]|nr:hypothetical protein CE131_24170 [Vibrio parahaemolyticus]OXD53501.1 hypothetical protein CA154_24170 [Vibrio parahaemolyticus]